MSSSSLEDIVTAVKTVLDVSFAELYVYGHQEDIVNSPAAVVQPDNGDFAVAMKMGGDTYRISMYVVVARTDTTTAQYTLNQYVTGKGSKSLREFFFTHYDLGLPDVNVFVEKMSGYGGHFDIGPTNYVGAKLHLRVNVD